MFFKKIIVYLCPALLFIALELLFYKISYIYIPIIAAFLILFLALKIIIKVKLRSKEFWGLIFVPIMLLAMTIGFLFLISSLNLRHLLILLFSCLLFVYLDNVFFFYYQPTDYQPFALGNYSNLLMLLIFFLLALNLNALSVFLNLSLWILSLILLVLMTLLGLQALWINKFNHKLKYIYLFILDVLILEIFWGLSFLPTNFYVNSILLTITFYFFWGLTRAKLSDKLTKKMVWRYLAISSFLLLVIIFTTSWI